MAAHVACTCRTAHDSLDALLMYLGLIMTIEHAHCSEYSNQLQSGSFDSLLDILAMVQIDYLAKRLSSLLVLPDSRQGLMRLPEPLLRQLLACEAVDVEQVTISDSLGLCAA